MMMLVNVTRVSVNGDAYRCGDTFQPTFLLCDKCAWVLALTLHQYSEQFYLLFFNSGVGCKTVDANDIIKPERIRMSLGRQAGAVHFC